MASNAPVRISSKTLNAVLSTNKAITLITVIPATIQTFLRKRASESVDDVSIAGDFVEPDKDTWSGT